MMITVCVALFGLIWGSFLNMCAWRMTAENPVQHQRSVCPVCHHEIAWYDLIPIISWINLRGQCRQCKASISWMYPAIELITAGIAVCAFLRLSHHELTWYSIYASTLLITIHTDIRTHGISPLVTLYLIPISWIAAFYGVIPSSLCESVASAGTAYMLLAGLNAYFTYRKGTQAIGEGDWELLAYIASVMGAYATAVITCAGSLITISLALLPSYQAQASHITATPLPFGAGLAAAALLYPLW